MNENNLLGIDRQILIIDKAICRHLDNLDTSPRGVVSQDILSQLRNFIEHIMLKIYAQGQDIEVTYPNICKALAFVKAQGSLKLFSKFHHFLEIVASHYTLEEENSERLMLKYYEYLLKIRNFLKTKYNLDVLGKLEKFPINTDSNLQEYYEKIAITVDERSFGADFKHVHNERYYIQKVKPFFVSQRIYYEVTFIPATGRASKFDRIIAFTASEIPEFYATKLFVAKDNIQILGKTMPIYIIVKWETSIRPCEIEKFSNIFGENLKNHGSSAEYLGLMHYLTQTGFNLVELLDFEEIYYQQTKEQILIGVNARATRFFDLLDRCRVIIGRNLPGSNVLRYLIYQLNHKIIKGQIDAKNDRLSGLYLKFGCIPFDTMPFNSSLMGHNPKLGDLFKCINAANRKHELLARFVRNNTEMKGQLYTPIEDIKGFDNIDELIHTYNQTLYYKHVGRRLEKRNEHLYILDYENDTIFIIKKLSELSCAGIQNYSSSVDSWMASSVHPIDSDEKKDALRQMFEKSRVAMIYGSAGTGKSTLINHISHFFSQYSKLCLANTNPAVDNLKRRVNSANCEFMTITKFLTRRQTQTDYDLLIIDECSTVNNRDMKDILGKATFKILVLVGDIYQIEAIHFGNWFNAVRDFLPKGSVYELTKPYRSNNVNLIKLWERVRSIDETILELIARQRYSITLDASIFRPAEEDEIILCLNYDGLYGINNINRFLQESNPNLSVFWGIQHYKVGDPILFNESERFAPLIYNNMKGWIVGISNSENQIQFDIELDKVINELDVDGYELELLPNSRRGNSVIRFLVNKHKSTDEDDTSSSAVVPFQVAYAVSIHKAQGLEYNSIKIVITAEIGELITHNIFYTAITRAREHLKIYWTPEVEKQVLNNIRPKKIGKDVALLRKALLPSTSQ
jgi:energy-coupling factor transporter ATP-binding protein EcfA2